MRLKRHVSLLEPTLRLVATRPLLPAVSSRWTRHRHASTYPERIAVLGGGIAGLSTAWFVSREFPNSKITVFEGAKATGGWIKSTRAEVPGGEVIFESGPRTLRNNTATLFLCQELDLIKHVTTTKRQSDAAKNRFIYYPDRLNRLPAERPTLANVFSLWRSGMLAGVPQFLLEQMVHPRDSRLSDETVGSFLARRVDERLANNIVSAVFHGIYAGDIWKLSAKTLLPLAWHLEGQYGSMTRGFLQLQNEVPGPTTRTLAHPYDIETAKAEQAELLVQPAFVQTVHESSTFTFKNGMQQLVRALEDSLEKKGNVEVKLSSPVLTTKAVEGESLQVAVVTGTESSSQTENFDLVISSLRNDSLTPFVTVMTVNLYYSDPSLLPVQGFGYLIPQSVPFEQNPERALGVIFDSVAINGQDSAPGTKLTVMLGGHWWDGWESYPDQQEGLAMAQSVVRRHLGIDATPIVSHVNLAKNCIPQYTIGYQDRLKDFATKVSDEFKGRLRLVGNQYNGVGVNDCITGAWNMARNLRGEGWKSRQVGLEKLMDERPYKAVDFSELLYINGAKDGRA